LAYASCTGAVDITTTSIGSYLKINANNLIPYRSIDGNLTCTDKDKAETGSRLGDTDATRTALYADTDDYSSSNMDTVTRLANYFEALNEYNVKYIM